MGLDRQKSANSGHSFSVFQVASVRFQQKHDVIQSMLKLGDRELDKCNKIQFAVLLRCYTARGSLDSDLQRP